MKKLWCCKMMLRCAFVISFVYSWTWIQLMIIVHLLLLSSACSLLHWKVYEFVRSFISMMLSRLIIWNRSVMSIKAYFVICMSFTICLHRRKNDISVIFFFKSIDNCFCSKIIRRRNNCFDEVKKKTANVWFTKNKASMIIWEQSNRHGSFEISRISNSFLNIYLSVMIT